MPVTAQGTHRRLERSCFASLRSAQGPSPCLCGLVHPSAACGRHSQPKRGLNAARRKHVPPRPRKLQPWWWRGAAADRGEGGGEGHGGGGGEGGGRRRQRRGARVVMARQRARRRGQRAAAAAAAAARATAPVAASARAVAARARAEATSHATGASGIATCDGGVGCGAMTGAASP